MTQRTQDRITPFSRYVGEAIHSSTVLLWEIWEMPFGVCHCRQNAYVCLYSPIMCLYMIRKPHTPAKLCSSKARHNSVSSRVAVDTSRDLGINGKLNTLIDDARHASACHVWLTWATENMGTNLKYGTQNAVNWNNWFCLSFITGYHHHATYVWRSLF